MQRRAYIGALFNVLTYLASFHGCWSGLYLSHCFHAIPGVVVLLWRCEAGFREGKSITARSLMTGQAEQRAREYLSLTYVSPLASHQANRFNPCRVTGFFSQWQSCRTMPLVGGFSRGSPVSPAPFIPVLLHTHSNHRHRLSKKKFNTEAWQRSVQRTDVSVIRRGSAAQSTTSLGRCARRRKRGVLLSYFRHLGQEDGRCDSPNSIHVELVSEGRDMEVPKVRPGIAPEKFAIGHSANVGHISPHSEVQVCGRGCADVGHISPHSEVQVCGRGCTDVGHISPHSEVQVCGRGCTDVGHISPHSEVQVCGRGCTDVGHISPHSEVQVCGRGCTDVGHISPHSEVQVCGRGCADVGHISPHSEVQVCGRGCTDVGHISPHSEVQVCGRGCADVGHISPHSEVQVCGRDCTDVGHISPHSEVQVCGRGCADVGHISPHSAVQMYDTFHHTVQYKSVDAVVQMYDTFHHTVQYKSVDAVVQMYDTFHHTVQYKSVDAVVQMYDTFHHTVQYKSVDASLGNHEFDDNVAGLVPFITNVTCPVLCANVDLTEEPTLAATHLSNSTILEVGGVKIGVIGYLTPDTKKTDPNKKEYLQYAKLQMLQGRGTCTDQELQIQTLQGRGTCTAQELQIQILRTVPSISLHQHSCRRLSSAEVSFLPAWGICIIVVGGIVKLLLGEAFRLLLSDRPRPRSVSVGEDTKPDFPVLSPTLTFPLGSEGLYEDTRLNPIALPIDVASGFLSLISRCLYRKAYKQSAFHFHNVVNKFFLLSCCEHRQLSPFLQATNTSHNLKMSRLLAAILITGAQCVVRASIGTVCHDLVAPARHGGIHMASEQGQVAGERIVGIALRRLVDSRAGKDLKIPETGTKPESSRMRVRCVKARLHDDSSYHDSSYHESSMSVIEVRMERRRNERAKEPEDPRENPLTNGIVRHDSHMRKSADSAGD
ncbi:hypothetical protein PR048_032931 [Dryococelus australis]|uniref:5'-nucleotidase n=1 Tax=Dryococelus australis TaxID=614101 RepID=A0ABQ9G3M7_9NEOP|nr:hypothetical protein PR048_032931 [Dryococelus australis]